MASREEKMAKKRFMSSRISDIHSNPDAKIKKGKDEEADEDEQAKELFQRIKREAQALGISGLGEKERKTVEAETLTQLGAKPRKAQRLPLAIGVGMKRKAAEREAKQREMEIGEGLTPQKRSKRANAPRDKGLSTSAELFKNGVLYLKSEKKPQPDEEQDVGKRRKKGKKILRRKKGKGNRRKGAR